MSESATRDVIFRLKVVPGQGVVQEAEKFGKKLEGIQDKTTKAAERSEQSKVRALEKSNQQQATLADKAAQATLKLSEQTARKEATERAKVNQLIDRENDRLHKRHRERQRSIAAENRKSRNDEIKEQAKAVQLNEQQMTQAQGRLQASGNMLRSGIADAGGELIKVGTGLATVGLVSEENNEKLLRGLVLLKGTNDVVSGGLKLWEKTSAIVESYRATLAASKTIQATLLAQQAMMGAAGAGGGARGAAAGVAGGVAGTAAGGAAGVAGMSWLQKAALPVGAALGKITTAASLLAVPLAKVGTIAGAAAMGLDAFYSKVTTGSFGSRTGSTREAAEQKVGGAIASIGAWRASGKTDDELKEQMKTGGATAAQFAETELSRRAAERMDKTGQQQAEMRERREALRAEQEAEREQARGVKFMEFDRLRAESQATLQPYTSAIETAGLSDSVRAVDVESQQAAIAAREAIAKYQAQIDDQESIRAASYNDPRGGASSLNKAIGATRQIETAQSAIASRQQEIAQANINRATASGSERITAIDSALNANRQEQSKVRAVDVGDDSETQLRQAQELQALQQEAVALTEKRRAEETAILSAKRDAARVGADAGRLELDQSKANLQVVKERLRAVQASMMTAEERFGQMDEAEQRKLLETLSKARAGETLTKDERQLVLNEGQGTAREIASQQAIEAGRAMQTAKGETFASLNLADAKAQEKALNAEAQRQSEIIKRVSRDVTIKENLVIRHDLTIEEIATMVSQDRREFLKLVQDALDKNAAAARERERRTLDMRRAGGMG